MGLLKTAATVAVASSVHGRIQRRQQARWAAHDQPASAAAMPPAPAQPQHPPSAQPQQHYAEAAPAPPAAPPPPAAAAQPLDMDHRLAQLKQLGELLSSGVLTQAEFDQQKARILNG